MDTAREPQPTLTAARLALRPWRPTDSHDVFDACQDADIQRWTTVPSPYTLAHAEEFVSVTAPQTWADGGALFAATEADSGALAASIGAHRVHNGVAEIGYWTRREYRRQGLTSEALRALCDWLFGACGIARAELIIEPANAGSIGVAESVGFQREGLLRQRFVLKNRRVDGLIFSLLPGDQAPAR